MLIKYESRYGTQCGSMMSTSGGDGWACCIKAEGHAGTHFNDIGWKPEWDDRWIDPVFHGRCTSWDGDVRCARTIAGHRGWAHTEGTYSSHTWGPVPQGEGMAASVPQTPQARTYAERKAHRRRTKS